MKKTIALFVLVLAMVTAAKSQICHTCSEQVQKEKDTVAFRENRAREIAEHNTWPTRPELTKWGSGAPPPSARFKAKVLVANDSDKKIKQVTWEYKLLSIDTKQTIATYTLVTKVNIAPHKSATLSEDVMAPLASFYDAKVVSAKEPKKFKILLPAVVEADDFREIKEIKYADGSVARP